MTAAARAGRAGKERAMKIEKRSESAVVRSVLRAAIDGATPGVSDVLRVAPPGARVVGRAPHCTETHQNAPLCTTETSNKQNEPDPRIAVRAGVAARTD